MKKDKPLTLKEAREQGKLDQFIKEREKDTPPGDMDKLDRAIRKAVKTSTKAPATSKREPSGD